ncbi:MAG: tetratricopeptide repeat protein [Planctomycetes bacterium]|nr:tetratricopeptide repeat protein [Planctomycetota bacterium]
MRIPLQLCLATALGAVALAVAPSSATPCVPPAAAAPRLAIPASPPLGGDEGGFDRYVRQQAERAKLATRKRDHEEAERAWLAVLEIDPVSLDALNGLADAARARDDADSEALALADLVPLTAARVADGERKLERPLAKLVERQKQVDPFAGRADELLADFGAAVRQSALDYREAGFLGNALWAWRRRLDTVSAGSDAAQEALDSMEAVLREGPDWLAKTGLLPDLQPGGKDEEWIRAFDAAHDSWSKVAEFPTPHYRVKTNAGYRIGAGAAAVMEQVHAFYRDVWGIVQDPPPKVPDPTRRNLTVPPIDVDIFRTHDEYKKRSGGPEWSGGLFTGSEVMTYDHGEGGGGNSLKATFRTLFHEASHQFMHVAVGPSAPSFINEGVASLFEGIEILPNGSIVRDLPVPDRLTELARRIRDEHFSAREIIGGENANTNEPKFYAPRWGFVYFLRMYVDEQGAYVFRDRLTDYIYEFKRGGVGDAIEHFEHFFLDVLKVPGMATFDDFDRVWRQWILDLDAERKSGSTRLDDYKKRGRIEGLKKQYDTSLRFYERALDVDPSDLDALWGLAEAARALDDADRATFVARRFLDQAPEDDKRRAEAAALVKALDPEASDRADAMRDLVGGMALLASDYDQRDMSLMAMRVGHAVLDLDPFQDSARALVTRLERETGRSVLRWERVFNGFDLEGWWSSGGQGPFFVKDGALVCDYSKVAGADKDAGSGVSIYRTIFLDRDVRGDWTLETRIRTRPDWEIAGICFGAEGERFEAVVLRHTGDATNNVDFGAFDGDWTFHGDGSMKAAYDPTSDDGVLLRISVKGRDVSVVIDGTPLPIMDGGKQVDALRYPPAALRGDVGLLGSQGVTRFTDMRLLAGRAR